MMSDANEHTGTSDQQDVASFGVKLVDQDQLANEITRRAHQALVSKDQELDEKRLEKAQRQLQKTLDKISVLKRRLHDSRTKISQKKQLKQEIEWYEQNDLRSHQQDVDDIVGRLKQSKAESYVDPNQISVDRLPGETENEFLIRTGKITAFGTLNQFQHEGTDSSKSHVFLHQPGFEDVPTVKQEVDTAGLLGDESGHDIRQNEGSDDDNDYDNNDNDNDDDDFNMDDYNDVEEDDMDLKDDVKDELSELRSESHLPVRANSERNIDDGDELVYQTRLKSWLARRSSLRGQSGSRNDDNTPEYFKPHPTISDAVLDGKFKLPGDIYPSLFDYQKTCVQWLWELYNQKTGGIIGDEMGLGKTIQVISFLAGLHYSQLLDKPILIVVPATVLNQWVNEFHKWWPPMRCVILHGIGSGMGTKISEDKLEEYLESHDPENSSSKALNVHNQINAQEIVDRVQSKGHVLVTTYVGLKIYSKYILPRQWGYCVLDEGHKIRNPDSIISLTCKQIKTYNRIILSGTPIQNNLLELWSLFDFVFPGRLGTLPVFQQQFSIPINMGGYANASNVQVQTGYKCAVILRDLISPYLLRRLKSDVAQDLPKKNEMVLFVKLTQVQQDLYEKFLHSEELNSILKGKRNVLMGVDILRKLCNHPDLVSRDILMHKRGYDYGNPSKSGKMQVLKNLLQLWQQGKHKTLLFCQTRQMLDILEKFVANLPRFDEHGNDSLECMTYLRMDGSTPISRRQNLVDRFNNDPTMDVFLLTTKVGGLGVNLTGADRIIIYDPDWNPSTDIQARERAWRLGQKKDITIYRLMTAGSIEEKIYHRQIFKTFLTNKILKDPKQRRFFEVNDLHDLFTLGDQDEGGTETGNMFNSAEVKYGEGKQRKSAPIFKKAHKNDDDFYEVANINGVARLGKFQGGEDENKHDDSGESRDENRIMEGIFSKSGVHSTVKHDDIVDSSNHELTLVEREASKVASAAAEALKKSRRLARKQAIGTPTWTGKFGLAGKFGPKKKVGKPGKLTSTSVLKDLKQKSEVRDTVFSNPTENKASKVPDKQQLIQQLIDYLKLQPNNFGTSNDILKHGGITMSSENDMILIRSMLREIATWDKNLKGWQLKLEYIL